MIFKIHVSMIPTVIVRKSFRDVDIRVLPILIRLDDRNVYAIHNASPRFLRSFFPSPMIFFVPLHSIQPELRRGAVLSNAKRFILRTYEYDYIRTKMIIHRYE